MLLLDTCALLWLVQDPEQLSSAAREAIRKNARSLAFSPISFWEIAIKQSQGHLQFLRGVDLEEWQLEVISSYRLKELPLDASTLIDSARLPPIHKDPCDRMIIASALRHKASIVTADQIIPSYPKVKICW